MELLAAISALEALSRPSEITVVTDSAYVKNGVTQLDLWLEEERLEDRRPQAGQECRPLAKAGYRAGPPPGHLALDQGTCGTCRE